MRAALRRSAAGVGIATTLALISACGGGSDSGPPTASEFRSEANAVCRDAGEALADLDVPVEPDQFAAALEVVLPLQEALIDDLRQVDAPEALTETYSDALALLSEQRSLGQQALDDIEGGGDPTAVLATLGPELQGSEERLDEIMLELGLSDCVDARGGGEAPPSQEAP